MASLMNHKTFFHVLYCKQDARWHVKKDNTGTITAHDSKQEAIKEAMHIAETIKGERQVIVHKTNGAFEEVKSVNL